MRVGEVITTTHNEQPTERVNKCKQSAGKVQAKCKQSASSVQVYIHCVNR